MFFYQKKRFTKFTNCLRSEDKIRNNPNLRLLNFNLLKEEESNYNNRFTAVSRGLYY